MFESNPDFEFDDFEISDACCTVKRSLDNNIHNTPNKKQRLSKETPLLQFQSEELLKKLNVNKSFNTKVVPRKFPGPAGLLPVPSESKTNDVRSAKTDTEVVCSQMSVDVFHDDPWQCMIKDFQPITSTDFSLPEKYNIAWIKRVGKSDKLINQKAPFLAAMIENIECSKMKLVYTYSCILKDITGNISGTITVSNDLYGEYSKLLTSGAVIVLKEFGVLVNENESVHITTVSDNLVRIYTQNDVILTQRFIVSDFIHKLKETQLKHKLNIPKFVDSSTKLQLRLETEQLMVPFKVNPISNKLIVNEISNKMSTKSQLPLPKSILPLEVPYVFDSNIKSPPTCNDISIKNNKHKFNFKKQSSTSNVFNKMDTSFQDISSLNSVPVNNNRVIVDGDVLGKSDIIGNVFEGIDTDSLFDDF